VTFTLGRIEASRPFITEPTKLTLANHEKLELDFNHLERGAKPPHRLRLLGLLLAFQPGQQVFDRPRHSPFTASMPNGRVRAQPGIRRQGESEGGLLSHRLSGTPVPLHIRGQRTNFH